MSTPTTAVASLPHYHTHHYPRTHPHPHPHPPHPQAPYEYSTHHHSQPQQQSGASAAAGNSYRSAAPNHSYLDPSTSTTSTLKNSSPAASTISRVSSYYQNHPQSHNHQQSQQQPAHAGYGSSTDGVNHLSGAAPPRPPPHSHLPYDYAPERTNSTSTARRHDSNIDHRSSHGSGGNYTHVQPQTLPAMADASQPPKKRRRSGGPDWNTFYANGLPREVIVIDDTPEPEANTGRKVTNGNSLAAATTNAAHAANGHLTVASANGSGREPAPKRRRRTDEGNPVVQGHGYHVQYVGSQGNTPGHAGTPNSTDRTNSLHTTAPTSLSSNGQYDDAQLPLKRKRTTRQQAANEAKRRDVDGLGNRFLTYKPPPKPPKKAPDVHCRIVNDVSCAFVSMCPCETVY